MFGYENATFSHLKVNANINAKFSKANAMFTRAKEMLLARLWRKAIVSILFKSLYLVIICIFVVKDYKRLSANYTANKNCVSKLALSPK